MKIRGIRIPAGLLAVLAWALCFLPDIVSADGPRRGNPHAHFRNPDQCPKCHLSPGSQPGTGRFSTKADEVCLGCHTKETMARSHPVNVRPEDKSRGMKVPADLRLNDDGRIMCLTCHTAHGPYSSFFLRRSGPDRRFNVLCEACHGKLR